MVDNEGEKVYKRFIPCYQEDLEGDGMEKKKKYHGSRRPVGFLVFALVILIGVVSVQISHLYTKNVQLTQQSVMLVEQKDEALQEQKELLEMMEYMKTDQYVEDMAREKFGLVRPGEILYKVKGK